MAGGAAGGALRSNARLDATSPPLLGLCSPLALPHHTTQAVFITSGATSGGSAAPPPTTRYGSVYGLSLCDAGHVVAPATTAELAEALRAHAKAAAAAGQALKVRASHT